MNVYNKILMDIYFIKKLFKSHFRQINGNSLKKNDNKKIEKPLKEIQINLQIKNESSQVKNENVEQIKKNSKFIYINQKQPEDEDVKNEVESSQRKFEIFDERSEECESQKQKEKFIFFFELLIIWLSI